MKNTMNWNFDNSYSRLSDAFKEHIEPIAVKNPELVSDLFCICLLI